MASKKKVKKVVKPTTRSMSERRANRSTTKKATANLDFPLIFSKSNYLWMGIGAALIALGLLLMSGGGSEDYTVFNPDEIYSFRRITLAPLLIVAGLVVEVYAIFKD